MFKKQPTHHMPNLSDELGRLIAEYGNENVVEVSTGNPHGWVDIITFCESEYFLGARLYPWQKIIFKVFYMTTPGNENLKIEDDPTPKCSNCVWRDNTLNKLGRNPCINCVLYPHHNREKDLESVRKNAAIRPEKRKELLSPNIEMVENFENEMMLIHKDLPADSDARAGGSVKDQFLNKIGKSFSELILVLGRRSGKALSVDTPIPTPNGWSTMGDICVGDMVFGADGKPAKVIAATNVMLERPCCEVKFSNGEIIICDEDHLWPTIDKLERKNSKRHGRPAVPVARTTKDILETLFYGKKQKPNHSIDLAHPLEYPGQYDLSDLPEWMTEEKQKPDTRRVFIESVQRLETSVPVKCIQVDNDSHTYLAGRTCIPTHNSQMASWIGLYEIYKLIEMGNPQDVFGIQEGSLITVLNVAVASDQAEQAIFSKVRAAIEMSPYFKSKVIPSSIMKHSIKFLTPRDEETNKELARQNFPQREGTIQFVSGHSNSSSQVGKNIPVVIIDEMAEMVAKDGSKLADSELYSKLRNSVWTFPDYKIVCISNPMTRDGKFYELYENSFADDRFLMLQLPSYKANPAIPDELLEADRKAALKTPNGINDYQMQIEARFIGGASNPLIPSSLVDEAFERGYRIVRAEYGDSKQMYYMHMDCGVSSDNYALVVVHTEYDTMRRSDYGESEKVVFVDHIQMWSPDRSTGTPVDIATVEQYVIDLCHRFKIVSITADQWNSVSTLQFFQKQNLPASQTPFNPSHIQKIYTNLVELFVQGRIVLYSYGPFVTDAMDQLKFLQQKHNRKSWRIEAADGHHDDIPDCIAGASYAAITGQYSFSSLPHPVLVRTPWDRSDSLFEGWNGARNQRR